MSLNNERNFPEGNLEMDVRHKFFQNDEQREDHPPFYLTFVDDLRMKQPTDLWTARLN